MKRFILFFALALFSTIKISAQECKLFIPDTEGTLLEYEVKNAKGKKQSSFSQKIITIDRNQEGTTYQIEQTSIDKKGNEIQSYLEFRCTGNVFIFDMEAFIDERQFAAFEDMEVTVNTDEMGLPYDMQPGKNLENGSITIEANNGPMTLKFSTDITNRKVEAIETISVAAGDFECFKISQDIHSKMGFVKIEETSVLWYSENIGLIRSESYNKKGKLQTITELINIEE